MEEMTSDLSRSLPVVVTDGGRIELLTVETAGRI